MRYECTVYLATFIYHSRTVFDKMYPIAMLEQDMWHVRCDV